jgi:hypothetical protein
MSSPPKTQPDMWVPAGTEKRGSGATPASEPQVDRRKPRVPLPPAQERRRARWLISVGSLAKSTMWVVFAAAVPWLWFLVRDLGPVAQLVALALPAIVVAALVGLIISAFDDRKLSSLLVAVSVLAFGWVTIVEPRSAMPASPPLYATQIASISLDGSTLDASAVVASLAKQHADVAVVVEPSKKARGVLLRADRYPYTLTSGRFVVLSTTPVARLPLPEGLPEDLILRLQVARPNGSFIMYAVRTGTSPLDAAQNDPVGIDRLRDAARDEHLPVVLAGNFGISDRSSDYRTLADSFRDAMRSGTRAASTAATFPWTFLYLRTEFVLTSPDWCATAGATFDVQGAATVGLASAVGACRG